MYDLVGKGEVDQGVIIDILSEIVLVGGKYPLQTMVEIKHACHAVEAEAVEMVLVQPEAAIGK